MEQIRTQLEQELFKLSDEGWSYVLAEVGEQPTAADIKRFVLETDLKKIGEPSIPKDLKKLQNGEIKERLVLQITSIVDVSMPKAKRERRGLDPHRPHMCVVNFTDGHTTLHGVEYQPIADMHALAAGAKVVIQRADIRGGYLLLDQHSFASVLFRGHLDAHLMMRKQGQVTGTQGPPPFTALPTESRASHVTDQGRDQRNNSQDKKGNNNQRQKNDGKASQDATANNSNNTKNGNNNPRSNKNNSVNKKDNSGETRTQRTTTDTRTKSTNTRNNTAARSPHSDTTDKSARANNNNNQHSNNSQHNNANNNKSANNNNKRNNAEPRTPPTTASTQERNNATAGHNTAHRPPTERKQDETKRYEAKNRPNTKAEFKPKTDRAGNETSVTQPHTNQSSGNNHVRANSNTRPHTKSDSTARHANGPKYAPRVEAQDTHRRAGPQGNKWERKTEGQTSDNSAYYQAINPLLQALVTFRPPHASEAFMSVQVTLTRVALSSVTLLTDNLACLALSDALTVLQVCCDLTLLADILSVPPDNAQLVLQTAYQVLGAAQPVYHLVAPVQINHPVNMIAGYIMLTDVEL
jgi:hypothetical protein